MSADSILATTWNRTGTTVNNTPAFISVSTVIRCKERLLNDTLKRSNLILQRRNQ